MNNEILDCLEIGPAEVEYSIIWLHGLGADGHDFEPIVGELRLPAGKPVRFIFPHAPVMPMTINGGVAMPAWYDITGVDFLAGQDEAGIRRSERYIAALIAREVQRGTPTERIILAGFSQGGAVVLHTGLRYAAPLAGIMALSTYLPLEQFVPAERHEANRSIPVFMGHGTHDRVIAMHLGEMSRDHLQKLGYFVEWHQYDMAHGVHPDELSDISKWLNLIMK